MYVRGMSHASAAHPILHWWDDGKVPALRRALGRYKRASASGCMYCAVSVPYRALVEPPILSCTVTCDRVWPPALDVLFSHAAVA